MEETRNRPQNGEKLQMHFVSGIVQTKVSFGQTRHNSHGRKTLSMRHVSPREYQNQPLEKTQKDPLGAECLFAQKTASMSGLSIVLSRQLQVKAS